MDEQKKEELVESKDKKKDKSFWIRKFTSRKFLSAITGFVVPLLLAFGISENEVAQIVSIITAGFVLVAYIVGEGIIDFKNEGRQ